MSDSSFTNLLQRDSLRVQLEKELNNTSTDIDERGRMERLATLVKIHLANYNYPEAMDCCAKGLAIAGKVMDTEMDAFFQHHIGQMMFDGEEYSGAGSHLNNAFQLLKDTKDPRLMKACGQYGIGTSEFKFQLMNYDTSECTLESVLSLYERSYKAAPSVWTEAEYDSLYGVALISMARTKTCLNKQDEGRDFYNRFLATKYSKTDDGAYREVMYLYRDKQYDKALEKYSLLEERVDTMSEGYHYVTAFIPRMRMQKVNILYRLERWKECCDAYDSYEEARHFWTKRSSHFKMLEAYERHGVEREQALAEDVKRVANERMFVNIVLSVLLLLFIIACGLLYGMQRRIRAKNRVLAANIDHIVSTNSKKEREQAKQEISASEPVTNKTDNNATAVENFIRELTTKRLYCNVDFDRNTLLDELHLPRRSFVQQFEAHTGTTISQYVTNLRLEHAAELILNHPNHTIDSIAQDSGFTSRSTFYRNFTTQFGISPAEYRSQCQATKKAPTSY